MSEFTGRLQAFGQRLAEDGYPPALIEQAVTRMDAMENVIVEQNKHISGFKTVIEHLIEIACHYSELGRDEIRGLLPEEDLNDDVPYWW